MHEKTDRFDGCLVANGVSRRGTDLAEHNNYDNHDHNKEVIE